MADRTRPAFVYDGFISYSHAADDLLAPRLQAGLQRFAKPWWRRRAVRMFRDESSLAANPHLWSSIVEALDSSGWFVLLLSPEAADSEWVGREIEHWVANRDSARILPVVTSGEFGWSDGDVEGSSVPPALQGVFSEEPRWVDLRFAKGDELLDLQNPDFSSAIADIASAIRGVPKDELSSEEVRQHRRTIRTAWTAGVVVVLLAVTAILFGIQSFQNAAEADGQREIAEQKAADEEQARLEADQAREDAVDSAAQARRQAAISEAGRLVAFSRSATETDPELAALLAVQAWVIAPSDDLGLGLEIRLALEDALQANRLVKRFPISPGLMNHAVISPDGKTIYHASSDTLIVGAIDVETEGQLWAEEVGPGAAIDHLAVSPDGDQIVVSVSQRAGGDDSAHMIVLTSEGEQAVERFAPGDCYSLFGWGSGFSPDGSLYALTTGNAECRDNGDNDWAAIYETFTWSPVETIQVSAADPPLVVGPGVDSPFPPGGRDSVYFSADTSTVLVAGFYGATELRSFPEGDLLNEFGAGVGLAALSPDGQLAMIYPVNEFLTGFTYPTVVKATDGQLVREIAPLEDPDQPLAATSLWSVSAYVRLGKPVSFSPDGSKVVLQWDSGTLVTYIHEERRIPVGDRGLPLHHSWTEDSNHLLTVGESGWMHLWNVSPNPGTAIPDFEHLDELVSYALERLTRTFTDGECLHYGFEPCPTLGDLKPG